MTQIDKVSAYFQGIADGDAALATKYLSPTSYLDHNPRAAGDADGVSQYVDRLAGSGARLRVVRMFQDGHHVVIQADGDADGHGTFFDVFRFDGGLIAEHWAFSSPAGPPNRSGHTQVDGPTASRKDADTAASKALVEAYYRSFHIEGRQEVISRYFANDVCVRHEPGVADGIPAFLRDLETLARNRTIDGIRLLLGEGDFVFLVGEGTHASKPCAYVDLYRVDGDRIVEHWGFPQDMPPPAERQNPNEML